ncbi:MAG: recombinase family protein [Oscillospiraceae bacterium]|nr:recombinase family protein [Oscillospiraceae bacterium]
MVAIYTRQSVEKEDSLSISMQIETCEHRLATSEVSRSEVFSDRGYSGKNTERPEFKRMMSLISDGRISKVIVYKLDRISRSLIDFLKMQEKFEKNNVEFVSCNENFDTTSLIGKTIIKILMVFAEFERETIQKRITDNYYARGAKGFYLGGHPPFGFDKIEFAIEGKKTYCYQENLYEAEIVRTLYERFANAKGSMGELVRWLNLNNIKTKRGGTRWSSTVLSAVLSNPAYVKSDNSVYFYLKSKGATINNPVEDFCGQNGCYAYGNPGERKGEKFKNFEKQFVTLAPHNGIIESEVWLEVQARFGDGTVKTNQVNKNYSWLQGLIKCKCGYTPYVKLCKTKYCNHKYFFCRGKRNATCTADRQMPRVDIIENEVEKSIFAKLEELRGIKAENIQNNNPKVNELKNERQKAKEQIDNLISQLAYGSTTAKYINEVIENLDNRISKIDHEIMSIEIGTTKTATSLDIDLIIAEWGDYDNIRKKRIAEVFVESIVVDGKKSEIKIK